MTGRQVIKINRAFTLEELEQFMQRYWNKQQYNSFYIDRSAPLALEKSILLPATERCRVSISPRNAGGLFNRENKVVLSTCYTKEGYGQAMMGAIPSTNPLAIGLSFSKTMPLEKELMGPAEEVLKKYTAYMRRLLSAAGFTQ